MIIRMRFLEVAKRWCVCPSDSELATISIAPAILAPRKIHTRGNSYTETLLSVDNPEKILRNRNKEKLGSPLFDTLSSHA